MKFGYFFIDLFNILKYIIIIIIDIFWLFMTLKVNVYDSCSPCFSPQAGRMCFAGMLKNM